MRQLTILLLLVSVLLSGVAIWNLTRDRDTATFTPSASPDQKSSAQPKGKAGEQPRAGNDVRGIVTGRLLDEFRQPRAGFEIVLAEPVPVGASIPTPGSGESGWSDIGGRFELRVPAGRFCVAAKHPRFGTRLLARVIEVNPRARVDLGDLELAARPGLVIQVRALGTGRPVPEATVTLEPALELADLPGVLSRLAVARTGADGDATFYGLAAGQYQVLVRAKGFAGAVRRHRQTESGPRPPVLPIPLAPERVLSGVVRDADGNPVPAAEIFCEPEEELTGLGGSGQTDLSGRFRIGGLGAGPYRIQVSSARHPSLTRGGVLVTDAPLQLPLPRAHMLRGQVLSEASRKPVANATVRVWYQAGWPALRAGRIHRPQTTTDLAGRFEIRGLRPGIVFVGITSKGFRPCNKGPFETSPDPGVDRPKPAAAGAVRILLPTGFALEGRVLDPARKPVLDAMVEIIRQTESPSLGPDLADRVVAGRRPLPGQRTTQDGRFELGGIPPGNYRLRIRARGLAPFLGMRIQATDGQRQALPDQILAHGARVHGVAQLADGQPAVGATVCLERHRDAKTLPPETAPVRARTDSKGSFSLGPVAPGLYELFYYFPSRESAAVAARRRSRTLVPVHLTDRSSLRRDLKPR